MSRIKFDEREWLAKGFSRVTVELVRNLYTRTGGTTITLNNDELETLLYSMQQPNSALHALATRIEALERLPTPRAALHDLDARLTALERALTQSTTRLQSLSQQLSAIERMI